MKRISFSNIWYPLILLASLMYGLLSILPNIIVGMDMKSFIFLLLIIFVTLGLIFFNYRITGIFVKVWAGLAILGGGLGLLSVIMYLAIGKFEENVQTSKFIVHILHFVIGIILFRCWNTSISKRG